MAKLKRAEAAPDVLVGEYLLENEATVLRVVGIEGYQARVDVVAGVAGGADGQKLVCPGCTLLYERLAISSDDEARALADRLRLARQRHRPIMDALLVAVDASAEAYRSERRGIINPTKTKPG